MATAGVLDYIIRSIWQGGGDVGRAKSDILGLGKASKDTALQQQIARQETLQYNRAVRDMAKEVRAGSITLEAAEAKLQNLRRELNIGEGAARKSGLRWTELASKVNLAQQAFSTISQGAEQVWRTLSEGAQLSLASDQFDRLALTINSTSDALLVKFREATGGMLSSAQMIESASQIISLGLADNETDVIRLGRVVGELGLDMNQVIMTFANDSEKRLDSLGLSISDVKRRTDEYKASGVEASKAFDLAVLDALEARINTVGSAVGTLAGDIKTTEANWKNFIDTLKQGTAESVQNSTATSNATKTLSDFATMQVMLTEAVRRGNITQAEKVRIAQEVFFLDKTAADVIAELTMHEQAYSNQLNATTGALRENSIEFTINQDAIKRSTIELDDWNSMGGMYAHQAKVAATANREFAASFETDREKVRGSIAAMSDAHSMAGMYAAAAQEAAKANMIASNWFQRNREATVAATVASADFFNQLVGNNELLGEYADILGRTETVTVQVGGRTAEQSAELNRLQGIYDRTVVSIRDYELGIKGAGMSEDARARKLEDLNAMLANTAAAMSPLLAVQSSYATVTSDGTTNTELLNEKLFEQIQAHNENATAIALAGVALGQFTTEEANAMLKSALLEQKIKELSEGWDGTTSGLVILRSELSRYIDQLNGIPSLIETEIRANHVTTGTPANYGAPVGGGAHRGVEDSGIPGAAAGGVVQGGRQGVDSVPMLLMPGERILTVQQNMAYERMMQRGGGGGDQIIINTQDNTAAVVSQLRARNRMTAVTAGM